MIFNWYNTQKVMIHLKIKWTHPCYPSPLNAKTSLGKKNPKHVKHVGGIFPPLSEDSTLVLSVSMSLSEIDYLMH